jgi:hypothetical protein
MDLTAENYLCNLETVSFFNEKIYVENISKLLGT